jgi:hypothetical protein
MGLTLQIHGTTTAHASAKSALEYAVVWGKDGGAKGRQTKPMARRETPMEVSERFDQRW